MISKDLKLGRNAAGEQVWLCGHCNQPADHGTGATDTDQLVYMLVCPTGKVTLGEWLTLEEKQNQLAAYREALGG
jgi:hypothetical protein